MPLKNISPQIKGFLRTFGWQLQPNQRIRGFDKAWCKETRALLAHHGISDGYAKSNIVMPGARPPAAKHLEHQVYRGYPLDNMFSKRRYTDGGPHTVPFSLGEEILASLDKSEGLFSMNKFAEEMGRQKIFSHLSGATNLRSFADNVSVAVAFAAAKCSENGAFAWEHADNTGSLLLAQLCTVADAIKRDSLQNEDELAMMESTFKSYEYQEERAGALLPYSRQECTTVVYNEDDNIKIQPGFNLYQPLYKPIKHLLKANTSEEIVQAIHRYDHDALVAAIKMGIKYYDLMDGQESSQEKRDRLQDAFVSAYQESLVIENEFSEFFKSTVEQEIARGNHKAIELKSTQDIDARDANVWFYSALCLAIGEYQSYAESPIIYEITNKHEFILKIPQRDGTTAEKFFSRKDALKLVPSCMIGAFDLLKHGQLDIDKIPEPMHKALSTLFVNSLIAKRDLSVDSLRFKIPDAGMIQTLSNAQVVAVKEEDINISKWRP